MLNNILKVKIIIFILSLGVLSVAKDSRIFCETSKEFVTTIEFLKDHQKVFNSKPKNLDIANNVAKGCSGSAKRFIEVYSLLSKVGFPSHKAVKQGIALAQLTDEHSSSYQAIFKMSYLKKYLDFDLYHSIKLTKKVLSIHGKSVKLANEDFSDFVKFCVNNKNLDLSRPKCADFSIKMARLSAQFDKQIFLEFKTVFEFLTQSVKGPKLVSYEGFNEAIKIMKVSPVAPKNFIHAYLYSSSKKGLGYPIKESMHIARKLSLNSREIATVKDK